ncbi:uncharacterized protein LOC124720512 isoform X1 [Schistocerca piceifrons]|nr:uncharacterized protein LOC124720512 isoform X1 [Schistocerca piceifrons]
MDSKGTSWLKKEKNEVYAEPGSLVQLHTSTMKVKEELDEQVNQQFLQDPPRIVMPSPRIKQDVELKLDLDGIEHDVSFHFGHALCMKYCMNIMKCIGCSKFQ